MTRLLIPFLSLFGAVLAGKVLIYSPSISVSHVLMNGRIADALVDAGHDVVMLILDYCIECEKINGTTKAKVVRLSNIGTDFDDFLKFAESEFQHQEYTSLSNRFQFETALTTMCRNVIHRVDTDLKEIRDYKFDVAFSEQVDLCGIGIIRYLGIENHIWISTTAIMDAVSYNLGIPAPTSYVGTIEDNDKSDVMSFQQRAHNLFMYLATIFIHTYGTWSSTRAIREVAGSDFPHIGAIAGNSSLCFVNSDEQFDFARPTNYKTIFVGGIHIKEPKALPAKLEKILAKGEKGVIIMSLGTIAPFDSLSNETQKHIIAVFKRLTEYHFILKVSKTDTTTKALTHGMKNIDLIEWLPQSDLLAHPRVKLFIMHGGLNGLLESAHRGVPVVVIPFFADQFRNGRLAEKRRFGKVVLKRQLTETTFYNAVNEVLHDRSYHLSAQRIKKLLQTRPFTAEERLVKWTNFVIENGVLDHLHEQGRLMNPIVYFNIDVIFVFSTSLIVIVVLIRQLLHRPERAEKVKKQ